MFRKYAANAETVNMEMHVYKRYSVVYLHNAFYQCICTEVTIRTAKKKIFIRKYSDWVEFF